MFEAKFILPWSFSREAMAEKDMPRLQRNMWIATSRSAALSIITSGGKRVKVVVRQDLEPHLLSTAKNKFWHTPWQAERRPGYSGSSPRDPGRPRRPRRLLVGHGRSGVEQPMGRPSGIARLQMVPAITRKSADARSKSLEPLRKGHS
jgi:hypothetical protein